MKKDQKFLFKLEDELNGVSKKNRNLIIDKYKKIIVEQKELKRRIADILKELGSPKDIAIKEKELLKHNKIISFSFKNVFKKKKVFDKKIVNKSKKNPISDKKSKEIIVDSMEPEKKSLPIETKEQKRKRLTYKILSIITYTLLIVILLWVFVVFIASLFAVLDGIKIYGIVIGLFGILLFIFWLILLLSSLVYKWKINNKIFIISIIVIVLFIAFGIAYSFRQYMRVETINDVSIKYSMNTSYEKYKLPSNDKPLYISFNSNYKTNYIVEYDDKLNDIIKVEVKYYECYYDFYAKQNSNKLYISLKLDTKDRISVYLNDLKDNRIFDSDELSRYTVRIIMNEEDKDRVVIYK